MQYLLAVALAAAIAVLLWRVLTAERVGVPDDQRPKPKPRPIAPDDDPEFLRKLAEEQRKQDKNKPEDE